MGKLHLFTGGYTGKLGVTYGVKAKQQNLVKVIPFSHTPHNTAQTKAVRAFEKLNRFSSFVARAFWYNLNLSDKKMLKHNAVAHWLAPCVSNGAFRLENLVTVIPSNQSLKITATDFDFEARTAAITFENSPLSENTQSESIFVALVADNGTVKAGGKVSSVSQTLNYSWDYSDFVTLTVVMFKSSVVGGKKIITGLNIVSQTADFVIDGILYTSLMPLTEAPSVQNGILTFSANDAQIADSVLHFIGV